MDISQLVVGSIPSLAQYILAPATFVLLVFLMFIYWRSGSSHALLLKTWLTVFGQTPANSKVIQQFSSDELDLTQFKFLTGLRVSTLLEAERLSIWARERNIHLRLIKRCGRYFNAEKPGPDPSLAGLGWKQQAWRFVPFMVFVALLSILLQFTTYQRAVITVRSTDKDFTVDQQYVTPLFQNERFFLKDCDSKLSVEGFDSVSLAALCAMSSDQKFKENLEKIIRQQRFLVLLASLYSLIPALILFESMQRIRFAILLGKKIAAYENDRAVFEGCTNEKSCSVSSDESKLPMCSLQ